MRFLALACDYDGTLAQHGRVTAVTVAALEKVRASGRKLILVTGRELDELLRIFPAITLFERVVAENGALLYQPGSRETKLLAEKPSETFVDALRKRGVAPMSVGRVIVATWKPHETAVLETIRDLALDLQVIFNKDAVMVLPAGVNKATGLTAALQELELSPHEVVGIGDAENDQAMFALCECGVAVQNALATVKERADLVTRGDHGPGVEELIERLLANDLNDLREQSIRHHLVVGKRENGDDVRLPPYESNLLIAGPSGSGKSTVAKCFLERLEKQHYQFCIIDPEGDYDGLENAVTIGSGKRGPTADEILQLLKNPATNVVVNLIGLPLADRPPFFLTLLPRLQEMRGRIGRPHWIIVDEAHHLLPAAWEPGRAALPLQMDRMVFLTVHPEHILPAALNAVSDIFAVGPAPLGTLANFCQALNESAPLDTDLPAAKEGTDPPAGQIVVWPRRKGIAPFTARITQSRKEHRRHVRKYAEGELPPDRCFYFRGAKGKLNLRVQNLILFNQIGAGVDDATWLFHLRQGDYSRWFREGIKDEALAAGAEPIEKMKQASAEETRKLITELIEQHYTLPATAPLPMPGTAAAPVEPEAKAKG